GNANTGYLNLGDLNTGWGNIGDLNTGALISGSYSNGILWRGDYQGLIGYSDTLSIPAIPLSVEVNGGIGPIVVPDITIP
ncbi:pentapeptide repeat-containing protein, partial [Mycobacterium tuberculosis]